MRTIKFRAWTHKKMIYPPFELDFIKDGHVELRKYIEENESDICDGTTNFGCTGKNCILGFGMILMQYTGLKDKNGKEIYEGDIVKNGEVLINKVERCRGGWLMRGIKRNDYFVYMTLPENIDENLEIIGNIYENKNYRKE